MACRCCISRSDLIGGYKAERPCTELISFTMFADVQPS